MKTRIFLSILISACITTPIVLTAYHCSQPAISEHAPMPVVTTPQPTMTLPAEPLPVKPLQNREQVEAFMMADLTDQNPYTEDYRCGSYAQDVVSNATASGIEAYRVTVAFEEMTVHHAIILFPTVDDGDVFVDSTQYDWWVNWEFGAGNYHATLMTNASHYGFKDLTVYAWSVFDGTAYHWHLASPHSFQLPPETPETPEPLTLDTLHRPQLLNRAEVEFFMRQDAASENEYHWNLYNCTHYTHDVIANASTLGIEAYQVQVVWEDWYPLWHSILAFPTVNDGLVFVDSTAGNWWVTMEYGANAYYSTHFDHPEHYGHIATLRYYVVLD